MYRASTRVSRLHWIPPWCLSIYVLCSIPAHSASATVYVPTDQPTISAGLAYAVANAEPLVVVLPGDYLEQNIVVPQGVHLFGSGAVSTRILAVPSSTALLLEPGCEVSHLTIEGGEDALSWAGGTTAEFSIHDVWFVEQGGSPLNMSGAAPLELDFYRNVIVTPSDSIQLFIDGASNIELRNNHFVGLGSASYLEIVLYDTEILGWIDLRNNIFENGDHALSLWLENVTGTPPHVANNVFHSNNVGVDLRCTGTSLLPDLYNNWFVENDTGGDFTACPVGAVEPSIDYNGYWNNTVDLDQAYTGYSGFAGDPMFVSVTPDHLHSNDDYDLLPGTSGIEAGNPDLLYQNLDASTNDVGAYGGPYGYDWNWDGDPVALMDSDCDDRDASTYPGAQELCDAIDNDCDAAIPMDEQIDLDGDGWLMCSDCDDTLADTYPGASEICDGFDNDCDGITPAIESDSDGDGMTICGGDCDDSQPAIYEGALEDCGDGVDNDCDGDVDEEDDDCDPGDDDTAGDDDTTGDDDTAGDDDTTGDDDTDDDDDTGDDDDSADDDSADDDSADDDTGDDDSADDDDCVGDDDSDDDTTSDDDTAADDDATTDDDTAGDDDQGAVESDDERLFGCKCLTGADAATTPAAGIRLLLIALVAYFTMKRRCRLR